MELKTALTELDVKNDEHWTADGAPKVDVLKEMTGDASLTRQAIVDAAPHFTRANPALEEETDDAEESKDEGEGSEEVTDEVSSDEPDEGGDDAEGEGVQEEEEVEDWIKPVIDAAQEMLGDFEQQDAAAFYKTLTAMKNIEEVDDLAKALTELNLALVSHREWLSEMIKTVQRNLVNAKNRVASLTPKDQNQKRIQDHIKKQNELRAKRVSSVTAVRTAMGLDKGVALDGRAPIDRAFDKNLKRGTKRPTRALKQR